jgi:hypothetical protein
MGAAALAVTGLGVKSAQATFESGLVDFQWVGTSGSSTVGPTMTGAAVLGSSGDVWNQIVAESDQAATQVTDQKLYLTNGSTASGAYISTPYYTSNTLALFGVIYGAVGSNPNNNLFGQQLLNYSTTSTAPFATISGLNPNQEYNLYLYNESTTGTGASTDTYDIVGSGSYTPSITPAADTNYTLGANYTEVTLKPDSGGDITMAMNHGQISGFQLQAVPEPAALGLLAVAGAGVLLLARRRPIA